MAMNPMQKKARTSFLLGMFLTLVITGLIIMFLIFQLAKVKEEQDAIIYESVYVVSADITSGAKVITSGENVNIKIMQVNSTAVPNNAITLDNITTYITELTTAKIELEIGTVLTTDMININGQPDTKDMRIQEYNMVILPTHLSAGDHVDIRLRLPSGEDYIVLSKKHVEDTTSDTVWLKVSEDEILTMSNAIVEAYIMEGSLLYATTYTDAGMQENSTPTFIAKSSVTKLMDVDPNITAVARAALVARYTDAAKAQRETINQAVNTYADDAISNVEENVEQEIQRQQAARQEYIDGLSAGATSSASK